MIEHHEKQSHILIVTEKQVVHKREKKRVVLLSLLLISTIIIFLINICPQSMSRQQFFWNDPYAEIRGMCDSIPGITKEEYEFRMSKLSKEMNIQDVDVYITEPGASLKYFANVTWSRSERPFLLVAKKDSVFYISPAFEKDTARERIGEDAVVFLWEEDESPFQVLNQALGYPKNLKIAIEWDTRNHIVSGINEAFDPSNNIIIATKLSREIRGYKSKAEIDLMRCANILTKKAIKIAADQIYAGITENQVKTLVRSALEAGGLTNVWHTVLFGENAAYPHGTANTRPLKEGDLILIDTGGELKGYQSDITRTFPFGKYAQWQSEMWYATRAAQQAALNKIAIGNKLGDLDAAAREMMEEFGYGGEYELFKHRLGHGIGMEGHEEFYAVRGNEKTIELGLCFSVEPGIYDLSKGGVRIEDIVCVTSTEYPYYELFGPTSDSIDDPLAGH